MRPPAVPPPMRSGRPLVRRIALVLGVLVLVLVAVAPSWRNYHLRRGTVRIVEDRRYVAGSDDPRHRLDLYLPTAGTRPFPVVVFVHGGFFRPFDRRMLQPFTGLHGCVGVALANRGVATAVIGYRQRPEAASLLDALDDVARAVRSVVETIAVEGGDPSRIVLVGHSAGALLTALLATQPEHLARAGVAPGQVRGYALLAGPYDLERLLRVPDPSLVARVRSAVTDADVARFSPERHVRAGLPPMLLLVGGDEDPPMIAEHRAMVTALRAAGAEVTAQELAGEGHMDLVMHLSRPGDPALTAILALIERAR